MLKSNNATETGDKGAHPATLTVSVLDVGVRKK
jgi:hypothetical protein